MKINTKKFLHKTVAATTILCCLTENVLFAPIAYAGQAKAGVEETLYLNLDYYGDISTANIVKAITFNGTDSYTDYGDYSSIINMTDDQKLTSKDGKVVIQAPTNSTKLYFQGAMDKAKAAAQLPWTFDISYKLNGKPVNADTLSGASGLVEIDIDATANKNVAEYLQNNIVLAVMVPVDMEKNYSLDAPDAQTANMGDKSGVVFTCLPGQDGHFEVRIGSDDFSSYGVFFMMTPITVSDLDKVKDLKDLEDRFRGDTNSMMDSFDDILDDVANMQSQLDLTDKALKELQSGKDKVHNNATAIFNGTDVAIQDLRDVETLLTPISDDLKTAQWMVYDINANLNTTNEDLADASSKLKTLSKRFKQFGEDLDGASVSNLDIQDLSGDIESTRKSLNKLSNQLKTGTKAYVASPSEVIDQVGNDIEASGTNSALEKARQESGIDDDTQATIEELSDLTGSNSLTTAELVQIKAMTDAMKATDDAGTRAKYIAYLTENQDALAKQETELTNTIAEMVKEEIQAEIVKAMANGATQEDASQAAMAKRDEITSTVTTQVMTEAAKQFKESTKLDLTKVQKYAAAAKAAATSVSDTDKAALSEYAGSVSNTKATAEALREDAKDLATNTTTGKTTQALADSINSLADGIENLSSDEDMSEIVDAISDISASLSDIEDSGSALSFQAARVTNNIRDLIGDMDSLIGIMNAYYGDVQKTIEDGDNLIAEIQKTSNDTASVLQTVNNTLRSAEPDFSAAADDSISVGHEAVENGSKMIDHTTELKETGHGLRDAINDKLDEEEADNNFINMDPDAPKVSLTSSENQEPTNISIVCRSDEIKSAEEAESLDSEVDAAGTTFWQRIANVFITIWNAIMGLFSSDD